MPVAKQIAVRNVDSVLSKDSVVPIFVLEDVVLCICTNVLGNFGQVFWKDTVVPIEDFCVYKALKC